MQGKAFVLQRSVKVWMKAVSVGLRGSGRICIGAFFTDEEPIVVEGGCRALKEINCFTRFFSNITPIHGRGQLR